MLVENSTPVASNTSIRVIRVMALHPDVIVAARCIVVKVLDVRRHVPCRCNADAVVPDVRSLSLVNVRADAVAIDHLVQIAPLHCEWEDLKNCGRN